MEIDKAGSVEYGTFLEYRLKGDRLINTEHFWGVNHSLTAQKYVLDNNLKEKTDMHRFGSLQRSVK